VPPSQSPNDFLIKLRGPRRTYVSGVGLPENEQAPGHAKRGRPEKQTENGLPGCSAVGQSFLETPVDGGCQDSRPYRVSGTDAYSLTV